MTPAPASIQVSRQAHLNPPSIHKHTETLPVLKHSASRRFHEHRHKIQLAM